MIIVPLGVAARCPFQESRQVDRSATARRQDADPGFLLPRALAHLTVYTNKRGPLE